MKTRICIICRKEYSPKSGKQKCCSKICSIKNKANYQKQFIHPFKTRKCLACQQEFQPNNPNNNCCSKKCSKTISNNKQLKLKIIKVCPVCHKNFKSSKYHKKYCSKQCIQQHTRLRNALRTRIYCALKGLTKSKSTMKLVGCSIEELWNYLESKFQPGMTKENYGKWHIDHIKPCDSFDLSQLKQQNICFNYQNLQPLWAEDNFKKGTKFN